MICQRRACQNRVPRGSRWPGYCSAACANAMLRVCLGVKCKRHGKPFWSDGPGNRFCRACQAKQPRLVPGRWR